VLRPGPGCLDPGPGDGETVGPHAQLRHQPDILGPAVVVVASDVAGAAVHDPPRLVAERVPDGRSPTVLGHGALDLVCRGGYAPPEVGWERWHRLRALTVGPGAAGRPGRPPNRLRALTVGPGAAGRPGRPPNRLGHSDRPSATTRHPGRS